MRLIENLTLDERLQYSRDDTIPRTTWAATYEGQPVIAKLGSKQLGYEADILRSIDDEGIPSVIGYREEGDRGLLIMERLAGTTLPEYIGLNRNWESRPLGIQEAVMIVDGLAQRFAAVHNGGYLYRDLNLAHVLVSDRIGLVDHERCTPMFGLGLGSVNSRAGTWETMAPEEFVLGNTMTVASNVYTLGTVLLQLTTGKTPFFVSPAEVAASDVAKTITWQRHQEIPEFSTGNERLDLVLNQALDPKTSYRFQTIEEFRRAVAQLHEV